jgi:UDP-N-acetylglucosamine 2-epimerase (non-hydrolysing)
MHKTSKKTNYYFVIGTTAELIKMLPVIKVFSERGADFKIIATGQNDIRNSDLLRSINIDNVDIVLSDKKIRQTAASLLFWFIKTLVGGFFVLRKEFRQNDNKNSIVIVHGDTVSTLMGGILTKAHRLKLAHVEAGLRSFNLLRPFPEELDRVLVSRMADIHFCPNEWAVGNIKRRNRLVVNTESNTLIESLQLALEQNTNAEYTKLINNRSYFIFVAHRQENLYNEGLMRFLIDKLFEVSENKHCVFVVHDPTEVALKKLELYEKIKSNKNITVLPRQPYFNFMQLLSGCDFIITDGGSNQEESYYFGKPCLILRSVTERIEGLEENVVISNNDPNVIDGFVGNYQDHVRPVQKTTVKPSEIIFNTLTAEVNK